jgi:sec-independent protein translocase protein TatB
MFDVGWSELLVIAVVAIIVIGPKDLPRLMRTFGQYAGKVRRVAAEFQREFEDAMREAEVDEVRKALESVRDAPVMLPTTEAGPATAPIKPAPAALKASPKKKTASRNKPRAAKAKASKPRRSPAPKRTPRKGTTR